MVKQGGGSIVNLSSIYGLAGRPRQLGTGLDPYVHSKGGRFSPPGTWPCTSPGRACGYWPVPRVRDTNLTKALTDAPESRKFLEEKHPMGRPANPTRSQGRRCSWR